MTFKTAKEFFADALSIAEQEGDPFRQAIAAGLADLAAATQTDLVRLKSETDDIKRKVS